MKAKIGLSILAASLLFSTGITPQDADARAGGGRNSGMGSGFRRSAPPSSFSPRAPTPPGNPSNGGSYRNSPYGSQQTPFSTAPAPRSGGFLRGLAGGIAGGFLGSMLFGSLMGHGAGGPGGSGGGIGLFEIILLAGLCYLGYRFFKGRSQQAAPNPFQPVAINTDTPPRPMNQTPHEPLPYAAQFHQPHLEETPVLGSAPLPTLTEEHASDLFFRIQGAWTRRDLHLIQDILEPEMNQTMNQDLETLRAAKQINRLENIAIRKITVSEPWTENNSTYVTVRYTANLLDYTVNESTNIVVAGNDHAPTKFEEDWTFRNNLGSAVWKLAGIEQT